MKRIFQAIVRRLILAICFFIPIKKNKIVISSFYGRGYGDNLKYIAEKLLKSDKKIEIIWVVKDKKEAQSLPAGVKYCIWKSYSLIFHLTTAGVWIDNCRKSFFYKKKNQLYIQTWHGGGAQKKCELDAIDKLSPKYQKNAEKDSRHIDIMISESRFMTNLYHKSFWYDGPVYECGYPRYDILLDHSEELLAKVYGYFGIDRSKRLVLYAPTFRVDHSFKAYDVDFERLMRNLKTRFENDFVVLVHLHPNVASIEGGIDYNGANIINATFYPDTQELVAAAAILIGDYSSINYDFSLKRLPVFRYASDLNEYRNDRDLYFSFDDYPYPCAQSNDELENLILNFNEEDYLKNLEKFFATLGSIIKPGASDSIAELIEDYVSSKSKKDFIDRNKDKFIY